MEKTPMEENEFVRNVMNKIKIIQQINRMTGSNKAVEDYLSKHGTYAGIECLLTTISENPQVEKKEE